MLHWERIEQAFFVAMRIAFLLRNTILVKARSDRSGRAPNHAAVSKGIGPAPRSVGPVLSATATNSWSQMRRRGKLSLTLSGQLSGGGHKSEWRVRIK